MQTLSELRQVELDGNQFTMDRKQSVKVSNEKLGQFSIIKRGHLNLYNQDQRKIDLTLRIINN